jgi:CHAD domain-containing protein
MPIDEARTRSLFRKLDRVARKVSSDASPEDVHQFRTTIRRIEALLEELVPDPARSERKFLKQLARLRKRAGQVRDMDVQLAALRTLRIGDDSDQKRQLMSALIADREKWSKKLTSALEEDDLKKFRRKLRRTAEEPALYGRKFEPVLNSLRMFAQLTRTQGPATEEVLHQYRVRCKRIRYVAEMAGKTPEAKAVLVPLKKMQDAIGEWHDWDELKSRAASLFSQSRSSALQNVLRAVTSTKLNDARRVTEDAKSALLAIYQNLQAAKPVKKVGRAEAPVSISRIAASA